MRSVLSYLASRLAMLIATLLLASLAIFIVLTLLPGDSAAVALGTDATPESLAAFREEAGLDRPAWERYATWLADAARGDFGVSFVSGAEIGPQILSRLQITLPLALYAMLIAVVIGISVGTFAATSRSRIARILATSTAQLGIAVPAFWAGILLISFFSVWMGWFPSGGAVPFFQAPVYSLYTLTLPAMSLGLIQGAIISRFVRSAILEIQGEDFMRTARAKGLSPRAALVKHGARNAAIPVLTVLGLQLAHLVAGTVVIETVYILPGLGGLLLTALGERDMQVVQAALMVIVVLIIVINFLIDLLYFVIDPRLRTNR